MVARVVTIKAAGDRVGAVLDYYAGLAADQLALDARWLKTQQRSLSWVYDAVLRSELAGRVGLDWEPVPDDGSGQADVVGVPEALTEVFSKRSRQVETSSPS